MQPTFQMDFSESIGAQAMGDFIKRSADTCGDYLVSLGRESTHIMSNLNYQSWLVLSTLAVVIGFIFLKSNR